MGWICGVDIMVLAVVVYRMVKVLVSKHYVGSCRCCRGYLILRRNIAVGCRAISCVNGRMYR